MAATVVSNITFQTENLSVVDQENTHTIDRKMSDVDLVKKWGLPLEEIYNIALKFFKEKEGRTLQLTYQTKLRLIAYTRQAAFGQFTPDSSPHVGFLDVVGSDKNTHMTSATLGSAGDTLQDPPRIFVTANSSEPYMQAWQELGDMSKEEAMTEFVKKMADSCSLFEPYVETHKGEKEEGDKKEGDKTGMPGEKEEALQNKETNVETLQVKDTDKKKQHENEVQIRAALNQQTQLQFRQYAEQQHPDNKEMQDDLIKQLQEQHFQQYMQQVYEQQLLQHQQQTPSSITLNGVTTGSSECGKIAASPIPEGVTPIAPCGDDEEEYSLVDASMWTRKDIKVFKESLMKDKESIIKVGSGETVTVRVPTHEDGTCLFWEFATDYYDIGFGVYFEWTISQTNTVSVHVSESSDEEDEEEEAAKTAENKGGDVEKGPSKKTENKPPTDEIIPVYRRDCHEEVYCGSHTYPGQGVYLLKFDNSYSLWRSKTLYYRVYYSR